MGSSGWFLCTRQLKKPFSSIGKNATPFWVR
jgi:hypothetical protein